MQRNACTSVGVLTLPPLFSTGPPLLSDGDCLRECRGEEGVEEEEEEGCLIPPDIRLAEDNSHDDPEWSPLKEQVSKDLQGSAVE